MADHFIDWLAPKPRANWLEVGCGTGALTESICQRAEPASVVACDPSPEFIAFARNSILDCPVTFLLTGVDNLPGREGGFDFIVSGLALNFIPQPVEALRSMQARLRQGGMLAAYVWDYAEGMQFLRIFWDEAVALDPSAAMLDEGRRFPLCRPAALTKLFEQTDLDSVEVKSIEIATDFPDFEAYWAPFLGSTGPAPSYVDSLDRDARSRLRLRLEQRLAPSAGGSIRLTARALGVKGILAA